MKASQRIRLFELVFARDGGTCTYCGVPVRRRAPGLHGAPDLATLDHVTPRSEGGRTAADNLALACQACNNARGTMSVEAFRQARGEGR